MMSSGMRFENTINTSYTNAFGYEDVVLLSTGYILIRGRPQNFLKYGTRPWFYRF